MKVPAENLIGERQGFRYILRHERRAHPDRIGIDRRRKWFIKKATDYANRRVVFGRPISKIRASVSDRQGLRGYAGGGADGARGRAPQLSRLRRRGQHVEDACCRCCLGRGNACVQTFGGFAFAEEYDVERKFRETRLYQVAPISTNLILSYVAEHILGMPRSY